MNFRTSQVVCLVEAAFTQDFSFPALPFPSKERSAGLVSIQSYRNFTDSGTAFVLLVAGGTLIQRHVLK